ncbi:MAG: hypothetical protein Q8P15_01080 [Nanoarchaeota archaeon]|nr:hypothetical protein [Nanoarchaeota archaeon]
MKSIETPLEIARRNLREIDCILNSIRTHKISFSAEGEISEKGNIPLPNKEIRNAREWAKIYAQKGWSGQIEIEEYNGGYCITYL